MRKLKYINLTSYNVTHEAIVHMDNEENHQERKTQ